jgi:hypothetical protein
MRTIRTNCFETNSSSTHSITIETSKSMVLDTNSNDPLVENDILYPARLNDEAGRKLIKVENENPRDRVWISKATNRNTKAAMLVHYLHSFFDDNWDTAGEARNKKMFNHALDIIAVYCGYQSVEVPNDFFSMFSVGSRYGSDEGESDKEFFLTDILGESLSNKKMIDNEGLANFIQAIIMNPTKSIVDRSEEY